MSVFLRPDTTTFDAPQGILEADGQYLIGVQLDIFEEDENGQPIPQASALRGRARTFHEFSPSAIIPDQEVFIPEVDAAGVFHFDIDVTEGQQVFIDPFVAVGYDYEIGLNDPLFASVLLPEIGDDLFELWLFDDLLGDFVLETVLTAGVEFLFGGDGVSKFRILGIEVGAGLDPSDPVAFVTGLTFAGDGAFTGTMTPIAVFVPEPATSSLLIVSLAGLCLRRRQPCEHGR